jgi:glycerol-3-phosphate dehydrogenase
MTVTGTDIYDIAVIGGGVNGAGVARDAAGRGARVALIERGDLAHGTSSKSTKLIHGGLRYLEHYEFALVREALVERERLWAIAPHIIWPMRFVLPHIRGLRPRWLLRLGLFLYDHIGGRKRLPPARSIRLHNHVAGGPLLPDLVHAFEYSDGWVDDARLVVLNARDAANHGATVLTRHAVTGLSRQNGAWQIVLESDGQMRTITARAIVNAAGPSVVRLLDAAQEPSEHKVRLVRGSHIVVRKMFDHDYAYFFQLPDGRIFFAIPYERDFTLIGTTDQDHDGGADKVEASDAEVAYLCEGVNRYFRKHISPDDVVWRYSGVRPLLEDGSNRPEAATRGYRFELSGDTGEAPLLSIFGGKITTYRHLAEEAVDRLAPLIPALSGPAWTGNRPLPGGDFPMEGARQLQAKLIRDYPFLATETVDRIIKAYGTLAWDWLGKAHTAGDLGRDFGHGLTAAEVDFLVKREWAVTAEDILWRRSKLGLHFSPEQHSALTSYLARQQAQEPEHE